MGLSLVELYTFELKCHKRMFEGLFLKAHFMYFYCYKKKKCSFPIIKQDVFSKERKNSKVKKHVGRGTKSCLESKIMPRDKKRGHFRGLLKK